jgi:sodium pump decarboxylase gamma subunit
MGNYEEIISTESTFDEKDGVIDTTIKGSKRNAVVEFVFDNHAISGVSVNVEYTFGEKMEKAALNTLLGMGTVFIVLILISLIISCFNLIPKIQEKFSKKSSREEVQKAAVDNTIAQIIEKEELSDDLELAAVIAAAIAASEGAASADGFVVRSIKHAKRQRA